MGTRALFTSLLALALTVGCGEPADPVDAGSDASSPPVDGGTDSGPDDGGPTDAGLDSEVPTEDGGVDGGTDGGVDGGTPCTTDIECSNGVACDGVEICTDGLCGPGAPVDADSDGDFACTDCDDSNPARRTGGIETCDSVDQDCDLIVDEGSSMLYFTDCDGDTFAEDGASSREECTPPAPADTGCGTDEEAWTTTDPTAMDENIDCADNDARANTGATMFQTTRILGVIPEFDFDFNCDRVETRQFPDVGSCTLAGTTCTAVIGWQTTPGMTTAPACGQTRSFITGCTVACLPTLETRTQGCL